MWIHGIIRKESLCVYGNTVIPSKKKQGYIGYNNG
jgi:hypothetical protein